MNNLPNFYLTISTGEINNNSESTLLIIESLLSYIDFSPIDKQGSYTCCRHNQDNGESIVRYKAARTILT